MQPIRLALFTIAMMLPLNPAWAVDLTGSWFGKFVCKFNDGTSGNYTQPDIELQISQTGNHLFALWNAGQGDVRMNGYVIDASNKPDSKGQAVLADCDTNSATITSRYAELANLSFTNINRDNVKGSLRGISVYSFPSAANNGNLDEVGQCKWVFKLVSVNDPHIGICPPL